MARQYLLERRQFIPRPLSAVFSFFSDAGNLEAITPPWLEFKILTPRPIRMQAGTLIDYRLKLAGLPFHWQTRIESFEPGRRFVDSQVRGPYRRWWHEHEFVERDGGTEMLDRVEYEMPLGPLGNIVHAMLTRRQLRTIFDYRRDRIAGVFGVSSER
jgi:ligand-binding SRPBCC domain-containing protein